MNLWSPCFFMKVSHSLLLLTFQTGSYDLNPEEMMTFKGKNTSRYSYLVQGHENPYFLPGDEKKNWNENTKTYKWARKTGSKRSNWFETLGLQIHILRRVIYKDTLPSELICINDESQMTFKKKILKITKEIHLCASCLLLMVTTSGCRCCSLHSYIV